MLLLAAHPAERLKTMTENVFIIAEAGVNHNGSLVTAKRLVDAAREAKADAVKFQTFKAESIACRSARKALYQRRLTDTNETQFKMLKRLELGTNEYKALIDYCREKRIIFLSSPFDLESIDLLCKLGLKIFKIPSCEITNVPYLRKIGTLGKKIIISSGMSTMKEIKDALKILLSSGTRKRDIIVLHCNSSYPTPMEDVNLRAMIAIKNSLNVKVGYSDHALGIEVPIAAVALGARVIEKHFTLDKNMEGPDHKASILPKEFGLMVNAIRNIEKAMGNGIKRPTRSELLNISAVRKSIVADRYIKKGEIFTDKNIAVKRPGTGISPKRWNEAIGRVSKKSFKEDELIEL